MSRMSRIYKWTPGASIKVHVRNFSEQQMRAYFENNNIWKIRLLIFSLASSIICFTIIFFLHIELFLLSIIGLVFFMVAIAFANSLRRSIRIPTDDEYDAWVNNRADQRLNKALRKLNKDTLSQEEKDDILHVHGYILPDMAGADRYHAKDMLWKQGKDGERRYGINVFTYFLPIERQLAVIEVDVNAVNHREKKEETHEIFFEEIVDTLTTVEDKVVRSVFGEYFHRTQHLTLSLRDGKDVSVTFLLLFLDHPPEDEIGESSVDTEVDRTIVQIRNLIYSNKRNPVI